MTDADPTLEPRPLKFFSEWYVRVVWPDGQKQRVDGFENEAHARGWIASESAEWIANARQSRK
jgi:hypothetical protein